MMARLTAGAGAALLALVLAACAPPPQSIIVQVEVTATPSGPSPTPVPTWTATPVPTATPIPPAQVQAVLPEVVSPLEPGPVEAAFLPPPGVDVAVQMSATVMDPLADVYATFDLSEREGDRFRSSDELQLPLDPLPGYWWLIVHAETQLTVVGEPARFFEIEPVAFRDMTGTLPSGVTMGVPVAFGEAVAVGNLEAGGRVWQHKDGEVALWWAPGPTEELLLSNALVALEATYDADPRQPAVPMHTEYFETDWQGQTAFEFPEQWLGTDGGPGRAWVIQGSDFWLYVLRVRSLGGDDLPSLHVEVAGTFGFAEP